MLKSRLIGTALVGAAVLALTGTATAQAQNEHAPKGQGQKEQAQKDQGKKCDEKCSEECKKDCTGDKAGKAQAEAVVGESAPDFTLVDLEGDEHTLSEYTKDGKIVVLEWFNPTCPFVKKNHETFSTMTDTYAEFNGKDVVWLAINSGNEKSRTSGTEINTEAAKKWEIPYPILLDTKGTVGKMYGAKTTPAMYVIDADGVLAYAGAIDDNPSPRKQGETNYVADAVDALLAGQPVKVAETKSYGCGVKY